jgi:hypothetical protein
MVEFCEHGNEPLGSIKKAEHFFDNLNDSFSKKFCAME